MKEILLDNYKQFTYDIEAKRKSISKETNLLNEKVASARDKYLADKLRSFKLFYKKRLAYFCVARHKNIKQAYDVPST
ncbi:hypothetical protein [Chryseobacterium sp. Leaf201]|uniref:hypothetical protein n=1 Tax=Chryseobacterium sp. Leaf201 TaxID=1735672 RepID=UPI000FF8873B|nr:hypothetical protein [Chryseobacterium sp. Leaf201]